ncbi:hypothetical protein HDV03_004778 [Kappamyces sp. JEL0829]|nr:hypothetical protein HDV03_004778 [Kappamyces sp. JEL0829]
MRFPYIPARFMAAAAKKPQTAKAKSAFTATGKSGKTKGGNAGNDPRKQTGLIYRFTMIRGMLYDAAVPSTSPSTHSSLIKMPSARETPVWTPSHEQTGSVEELKGHDSHQRDLIERAWAKERSIEDERALAEIRERFVKMHLAMTRLQELDPRLFEAALVKDEVALMPKRLRVATETISPLGWDYEMDRL